MLGMETASSPASARVDEGVIVPGSWLSGRVDTRSCGGMKPPGEVAGEEDNDVPTEAESSVPEAADADADATEEVAEPAGDALRTDRPDAPPGALLPATDPGAEPVLETLAPLLGMRFPMIPLPSETRRKPGLPTIPADLGSRDGNRLPISPPRA